MPSSVVRSDNSNAGDAWRRWRSVDGVMVVEEPERCAGRHTAANVEFQERAD